MILCMIEVIFNVFSRIGVSPAGLKALFIYVFIAALKNNYWHDLI